MTCVYKHTKNTHTYYKIIATIKIISITLDCLLMPFVILPYNTSPNLSHGTLAFSPQHNDFEIYWSC